MNFELSEDQQLIVETVAGFVKKQSPLTRLRAMREDATGWSPAVWRQMGEFGWIGAAFPESVGGAGGTFVDAALILEQLGATLVPEPLAEALVAGRALLAAGTPAQHERWLAPVVAGRASLALAYAEKQSRFDPAEIALTVERTGHGYRLNGEKRFVLNGHAADFLVISARGADGIHLFVADRNTPGMTIQPVKTMDGHHAAMVHLADVTLDEDRRLPGDAAAALDLAVDVGAACACAEGTGLMQAVLRMTVEYLRTREQFGVKIGTFQVLQHRAVDMFVEVELARSMSILAAIKVDDADAGERRTAVSAAKAQLAVSGRLVTQQAIQLHGGIGITDEADVGLYFKRMHVLNTLYGDEDHHLARYASLPGFAPEAR